MLQPSSQRKTELSKEGANDPRLDEVTREAMQLRTCTEIAFYPEMYMVKATVI